MRRWSSDDVDVADDVDEVVETELSARADADDNEDARAVVIGLGDVDDAVASAG